LTFKTFSDLAAAIPRETTTKEGRDFSLEESRHQTEARFEHQHRDETRRGRLRRSIETPLGRTLLGGHLVGPLAKFMAEVPAPRFLSAHLKRLDLGTCALAALEPVLSATLRGWHGDDDESQKMLLCKHIGEGFRDRLALHLDDHR
jgi:hypothetical protein